MKKFLTAKITRKELSSFLQEHKTKKRTLDLGCSNSPYSHFFPNRVGLDINKGKGVDVIGDAHNLPFKDEEFDVVLCTEVLEHLHTPELALSEMNRVLKKGGKLILTTRFIFPLHNVPNDYYRYTKYGLRHLLRDWEVVTMREEVGTMKTIAVLLQRIGYQTKLRMNIFSKVLIFLIARLVSTLSFLIKEEYGDIKKESIEENIMASGYYVVCEKM